MTVLTSMFTPAEDTVTLYFGGDMMQHTPQIRYAETADGRHDYSECFAYVKDEISAADFAVCNLEVPLAGPPYAGYPQFSAPDDYARGIRDAGFDIVMTANNHSMDRRVDGFLRTLAVLDSLGLDHFGTYRDSCHRAVTHPLVIEKHNLRIALIGYTYGTNGLPVTPPLVVNLIDRRQIQEDIRMARERRADVIIACMHWGVEYNTLPEQSERELAAWMFEQGVDHIIGAHPHVIQPIELSIDTIETDACDSLAFMRNNVRKHLVVYSLGNYVSNQSPATMGRDMTDGGAGVTLKLTKSGLADCSYTLHWVSRPQVSGNANYRIYPAYVDSTLLGDVERKLMGSFLDKARRLYADHNRGVVEENVVRKSK